MASPQLDPRLTGDTLSAPASAQQPQHPYYHYTNTHVAVPDHPTGGTLGSTATERKDEEEEHYEDSPAGHGNDQSPSGDNANDPKRPRACEACRSLKVRCDQDSANPDQPCKRCAKAGRQCVITAPSRKRQRKADSRVAELEKKLDALTAHMQAQGQGKRVDQVFQGEYPGTWAGSEAGYHGSPTQTGQKRRRTDSAGGEAGYGMRREVSPGPFIQPANAAPAIDPVFSTRTTVGDSEMSTHFPGPPMPLPVAEKMQDQSNLIKRINSLVSLANQNRIWDRYVQEMSRQVPTVVFTPETTADEIRDTKPVLFLALLNAGSIGILEYETQASITVELISQLGDLIIKKGDKSLELVQAIQIACFWFKPPPETDMTNYYQLIHLAAVMAIDLGLGRRQSASRTRNPHYRRIAFPNADTIESRRAWLGCYFLCASTSMILRRPNLLGWTKYLEECVEILSTSPEAYQSDRLLCEYIKIQHISEVIGAEFAMDDPSASVSINDPKITYQIREFEQDLKDWRKNVPKNLDAPALDVSFHVCNLYLHEIVMHVNHNVDDFRVPVTEESLKGIAALGDKLTSVQINAITQCHQAAVSVLETYTSVDWNTIRQLPMFLYFVRIVYALVILLKLYFAVTNPDSSIGKLIRPEELKIELFLDRLGKLLHPISTSEAWRPYAKVLFILGKIREWFYAHKNGLNEEGKTDVAQPRLQNTNEKMAPASSYPTPSSNSGLQVLSDVATGSTVSKSPRPQRASSTPQTASANHLNQQRQQTWSDQGWQQNTNIGQGYNSQASTSLPQGQMTSMPNWDSPAMNPGVVSTTSDADFNGFDMGDLAFFDWGAGFQQAMDMTLNTVDGVPGMSQGAGGGIPTEDWPVTQWNSGPAPEVPMMRGGGHGSQ
ncbi:MAG: hypothetical protein M1820_005229 [Bogoriella megaspora]|nr:MAG: hypothetical protein M1820_005229 [Bogoriella megaspora]